jgi:tetratricopeptide (TPR) repeat protein
MNTLPNTHSSSALVPVISLVLVLLTGTGVFMLTRSSDFVYSPERIAAASHSGHALGKAGDELSTRFEQAAYMLHARQYENAITALHRVIELDPRMPEAYVNMGYALLGLKRNKAARDFFKTAINLNPYQGNAYWGLAVTLENDGDLPEALGAMRIYIHLAKPGDPYVRRARSALWEWESRLKRGPLPDSEKAFIARGTRQWEERNLPRRENNTQ